MVRILIAVCISFGATAFLSQLLIDILRISRIGQPIREDGPQGHMTKAGTPTMGGVAIVLGSLVGYLLSGVIGSFIGRADGVFSPFTRSGLLVIGATCCAGFVGFLDDWIKISRERNLGLNAKMKTAGMLGVAFGFAFLTLKLTSVSTELSFARTGVFGIDLGSVGWVIWAIVLIYATSNAVNLTDGLDGLAAGSGIFSFGAYGLICFWIFRQMDDAPLAIYQVEHALDLSVVAVSMLAACTGFLWFNAAPADIFMGDTGSLAIGTALACFALTTNTHLLLPIIGGIYVLETLSVISQVAFFKLSKGKRLFRMAPIHHHFELGGLAETKVIIRFWIIAGALTLVALGIFYADYRAVVS